MASDLDAFINSLPDDPQAQTADDYIDSLPDGVPEPATRKLTLENVRQAEAATPRVGGIEVLPQAKKLARFGLEAAGDIGALAVPEVGALKQAGRVGRVASRVLEAGKAGLGAGLGSGVAEAIDPTRDPKRSALNTAVTTAVADLAFSSLAGAVLSKLTGAANLEPGAEKALQQIRRGGGEITAGRLTKSGLVDVFEVVSEFSLFGRGRTRDTLALAERIAQKDIDAFTEKLLQGRSKEDVNTLLTEGLRGSVDIFRTAGKDLYAEVDRLSPGVGISLENLLAFRNTLTAQGRQNKEAVSRVLRTFDEQVELATGQSPSYWLSVGGQLERASNPVVVPFSNAQEMRSELLKFSLSPDPIAREGEAEANRLLGVLEDEIRAAGSTLEGAPAVNAFRRANEFWRNGREVLRDQSIASITRVRPDAVLAAAVKPGGTVTLRRLRQVLFGGLGEKADVNTAQLIIRNAKRVLKDPRTSASAKSHAQAQIDAAVKGVDTWSALRGQLVLEHLNKADELAGITNKDIFSEAAERSAKKVKRSVGRFTAETNRELFTNPRELKQFEQLVRTLEITQSEAGRNVPGRIFVQLQQAGSVGPLLTAAVSFQLAGAGGPATVLLAPVVMGRLVTNRRFIDYLATATAKSTTPSVRARAFNQLAILALSEGARVQRPDGSMIEPGEVDQSSPAERRTALREELRNRPRPTGGTNP